MNNFTKLKITRNFTEDQVSAVVVGTELVKRNLYNTDSKTFKRYQNFTASGTGKDMTYDEHNAYFNKLLQETAYKVSGISKEMSFDNLMRTDSGSIAYFAVIEAVIDGMQSKNELEQILGFCEVRNMAEGDSMNINVKSKNAYFFSKQGRGQSFGLKNRYYPVNVSLTPTPGESTVSMARADIIAGRINWGDEVARTLRGLRSAYMQDVAAIIFSDSNPIGNKIYVPGTYNEKVLRTEIQRLVALNGSDTQNTAIYGTAIALANILPANAQLQFGHGLQYMENGFIPTMFGAHAIELGQAFAADQETKFVPNNWIAVMSSDARRPVALGLSGVSRIEAMISRENALNEPTYTTKTDWDVKMAGQGHILIYQVSND